MASQTIVASRQSGSPAGTSLVKSSTAKALPFAGLPPLSSLTELGVPIAVLAIVLAMITPMPSFMLDLLLVLDIMMSVIVMMVAMYITKPTEFSVFPTTLLLLTLFRLALNISSSRLILLNGNIGTSAAGHVIEAFGNFVVGGNYIIGVVIFLVLIAIQYVVINHGAVRISEVTARFTLDALPGKQMSIDADLNAGLIDDNEARRRRRELSTEAEFYGAMDGASRFTQRDAIASILITGINILAGFLIGVLQHGMDLKRALQTYTVLTIGDGLVTVIPALMISITGGLIVTRASTETRLGAEFQKQVFGNSQPLMLASGVLVAMALFPGLPTIPFLLLGGGLGAVSWRMRQKTDAVVKQSTDTPAAQAENIESMLKIEPLAVEVGLGLANMAVGGATSPLLQRIAGIRRQLAGVLGYIVPPVRVTDNLSLRPREYAIKVKGQEIVRYQIPAGADLAIPSATPDPSITGENTTEPAFGLPALWIPNDQSDAARRAGYTVVDPVSVLATHLAEVIGRQAHELLSRQDTKSFCDRVALDHPRAVEDLVPKLLPLASIQKVLQNLLREGVSIRDGATIIEALGEAAGSTKNPVLLTEYVRQALRRTVVQPFLTQNGELMAFIMDSSLEHTVEASVQHGEHNSVMTLAPNAIRDILNRIGAKVDRKETSVSIITSSGARYFMRQMTEPNQPNVFFIGHNEIPAGVKVISRGIIQ
jgi:flagellar biosynthesis protein FlhA